MVKIKYSALYTDNLGCEQAEVCFSKDGLELKVRNCILKNEEFNFDFYSDDLENMKDLFNLKENELVEYFIDIKIPLLLTYNNMGYVKEFLLRIERNKNYYSNSFSLLLDNKLYMVEGYNLQELIKKMKEKIPMGYELEESFSSLLEYDIEADGGKDIYYFKNFNEKLDGTLNKKHYFLNKEYKGNLKGYQKIPVTYISGKYYSS